MSASNVSAVLFAKDLQGVVAFYSQALEMNMTAGDEHHCVLDCGGFTLVLHQIPEQIAKNIVVERPPVRRVAGAIRLDYPVRSIAESRRMARALGGDIDDAPPPWADKSTNLYFGCDPEGNQFGVSQRG